MKLTASTIAAITLIACAIASPCAQAAEPPAAPSTPARAAVPPFKVADAKPEAMTPEVLLTKLRTAQNVLNRSIVKSEKYTQWINDYSKSNRITGIGPIRNYDGTMEEHAVTEVRLDYDGQRCAMRERSWGNRGVPAKERASWKPEVAYRCWLWDGQRHYFYSYFESKPGSLGGAMITEGRKFSEDGMTALGTDAYLRGYYDAKKDDVVSILSAARSLRLRGKMEPISGSNCYVLEGDTKCGKYVVWIDPAHGYNVAKAEVSAGKGDLISPEVKAPLTEGLGRNLVVKNVRFGEVNGVWVPMECDMQMEVIVPNETNRTVIHHKRTEVILNPDFEALGSFRPDDIKNGATVYLIRKDAPPGTPMPPPQIWQNGKPVPYDPKAANGTVKERRH